MDLRHPVWHNSSQCVTWPLSWTRYCKGNVYTCMTWFIWARGIAYEFTTYVSCLHQTLQRQHIHICHAYINIYACMYVQIYVYIYVWCLCQILQRQYVIFDVCIYIYVFVYICICMCSVSMPDTATIHVYVWHCNSNV